MKAKSSFVLISVIVLASILSGAQKEPPMSSAAARSFAGIGRYSLLFPGDPVYNDVYGAKIPHFGVELRGNFGSRLSFWAEASILSKKGALTFTKEETTLSLIPLEAGLMLRLKDGKWSPYAGAGAGIFIMKEESKELGSSTTSPFGFCVLAGIDYDLAAVVFIDARAKYQVYKAEPTDPGVSSVNLGGLVLSLGIGVRF